MGQAQTRQYGRRRDWRVVTEVRSMCVCVCASESIHTEGLLKWISENGDLGYASPASQPAGLPTQGIHVPVSAHRYKGRKGKGAVHRFAFPHCKRDKKLGFVCERFSPGRRKQRERRNVWRDDGKETVTEPAKTERRDQV